MQHPNLDINFINFNQDCSSLAIGTKTGYKLFSLNSVDKLELIYESACRDVTIVERLFSSSLLALVSLTSPRRLRVCHFKKGTEICQYSYSNTILAVKLNRARLVVCLEESLYIHNIRDMKVLHTIRDTPPNPKGLCALSINSDSCLLAYPGSTNTGEVQLFDCLHLQAKLMIPAHDSPLAALTFNPCGSKLATASERGTVIRVFNVETGARLIEFRRGVKRCAHVYSLSFSQDSEFLALSSNTETIHVFKLEPPSAEQGGVLCETAAPPEGGDRGEGEGGAGAQQANSWMGLLSKAVTASTSYLPTQVTDTLNQSRAFATVIVPSAGVPNIVTIASLSKQTRLLLASADGYFYIYSLPGPQGGECVLAKQHRLDTECNTGEDSQQQADNAISGPPGVPGSLDSPAVLEVSPEQQTSEDSPPPTVQRPEI